MSLRAASRDHATGKSAGDGAARPVAGDLDIDHAVAHHAIRSELGDLEEFADWAAGKLCDS